MRTIFLNYIVDVNNNGVHGFWSCGKWGVRYSHQLHCWMLYPKEGCKGTSFSHAITLYLSQLSFVPYPRPSRKVLSLLDFNSSDRGFTDIKMSPKRCYTFTTPQFIKHTDFLFYSPYFSNFSCSRITTFTLWDHISGQNNRVPYGREKESKLFWVCERHVTLSNTDALKVWDISEWDCMAGMDLLSFQLQTDLHT
jgi:hypothetical protein